MNENERSKLIDLTSRAVATNEELLSDEKKFIADVRSSSDVFYLLEMNERLNELSCKELLLLAASKSLLQIMSVKLE